MKGDVVTPQILFLYVEFLDGGKWEKHFPVLFSGNMAQLRISRTFDISYQTRGGGGGEGENFPSSALWKSRSSYTRELVRQRARDV